MEESGINQAKLPQAHEGSERFQRVATLTLLFLFGVLVGFAAKVEASSKITMGYDDYRVSERDRAAYDINALAKKMSEQGGDAGLAGFGAPSGGSCGQ